MTGCKHELFLDVETFSSVDLPAAGLYPYTESPDFEILLLAFAVDDGPVVVLDLTAGDGDLHPDLWESLTDPTVLKIAHNNAFERAALRRHTGHYMDPKQWSDTMILSAMNGLPMSLDAAGAALMIELPKMKEGTALVNYFCKPRAGKRYRKTDAPDKWATFMEYNGRDVDAMRQIYRRLQKTPITDFERSVWCLDTRINERGVLIDRDLAEAAQYLSGLHNEKASAEMQALTGLDNPNSVSQLKDWLADRGVSVDSLGKDTVKELEASTSDAVARRVLQLRLLLGKTSTTKYVAMLRASCSDGRVRGITQYYGAARTGRWAGRLVQLQNLPQNHLDGIADVRELVRSRDLEAVEMCFDSVPDVLSQLIRTAFIAKPGHTFLVADYSAIEARAIAYLASCDWRKDVFAKGGDIYCASASRMFHVPVEKHGVNGHLRQKGKIAELALGYGGSTAALKAFGADKMGLSEDEMQEIVSQWRDASPEIPQYWRDTERAAKLALNNPGKTFTIPCGIKYRRDADALRCRLPSGRVLSYWGAGLDDTGSISFMGQNQTTRKWEKTSTWGGKLVENQVQAFSRDCLAAAMIRLDAAGYAICFHVHDEIIAEAPEGSRWEDMAEIMGQPLDWAPGLLLRADGYSTPFYMKD